MKSAESIQLGLIEPGRIWVYGLLGGNIPLCLDTSSPLIFPHERRWLWLDEHQQPYWDVVGRLLCNA